MESVGTAHLMQALLCPVMFAIEKQMASKLRCFPCNIKVCITAALTDFELLNVSKKSTTKKKYTVKPRHTS